MTIDVHGHVSFPAEVYEYKARLVAHYGHPDPGAPDVPDERLRGSGERHVGMLTELGIDLQLISPRPFQALHSLPEREVMATWTRYTNDMIARQIEMFPGVLVGIGGLPQSPGAPLNGAVAELERCVNDLGFVGCLVNPDPSEGLDTNQPGLGDRYWYPLYEKLVELNVPAIIHSAACRAPRESYSLHFINEESVAILSLLHSPVFTDFPDLKIVVPHGGGAIPYQAGRFDTWHLRMKPEPFRDAARRLWYDTCVYTKEALRMLVDFAGPERCLLGTERPGTGSFKDPATGRYFDDVPAAIKDLEGLSGEARHAILDANARSLFRLPT